MNAHTAPVPKEVLDLSKRHKTFVVGEITAIMTWTLHDRRPCMVLIPTLRMLHFNSITPIIIPDTMAWAWSETKALRDMKHVAMSSLIYADALGLGGTPQAARKVATVIHDLIDELLSIPPMPNYYDKVIVGTVKRTDPVTGKVITGEIKEDV